MPDAKHPRQKDKCNKSSDINVNAARAVFDLTDSEPVKGEDSIANPKLRKAFIAAKKRAKKKIAKARQ